MGSHDYRGQIPISPVSWLDTQCFSFDSKGSKTVLKVRQGVRSYSAFSILV